jgi:glucarate dehydratase
MELAAWDLAGRALGLSLADLLGGASRRSIELVCPVPAVVAERWLDAGTIDRELADPAGIERVAGWAAARATEAGFAAFKYKSAGRSAEWDLAVMRALRRALGGDARLRFDPNAAYPSAQALALCERLEEVGLEFFEDPTDDVEGLAAIRAGSRTPVATNMAVVQMDQLAAAARRGAVDVVLADLFMWGGVERFRALAHAATSLGLEVGIHSLFETGVATAANLHLAAALPELRLANDSGHHLLAADVVRPALGPVRGGRLTLPNGPGLGVELDPGAVDEFTLDAATIVA